MKSSLMVSAGLKMPQSSSMKMQQQKSKMLKNECTAAQKGKQ